MASIKLVGDKVLSSREDVAVIAAMYGSYDCGMDPKTIDVKSSSFMEPHVARCHAFAGGILGADLLQINNGYTSLQHGRLGGMMA